MVLAAKLVISADREAFFFIAPLHTAGSQFTG